MCSLVPPPSSRCVIDIMVWGAQQLFPTSSFIFVMTCFFVVVIKDNNAQMEGICHWS